MGSNSIIVNESLLISVFYCFEMLGQLSNGMSLHAKTIKLVRLKSEFVSMDIEKEYRKLVSSGFMTISSLRKARWYINKEFFDLYKF